MSDENTRRRKAQRFELVGEHVRIFRRGQRWYANYQLDGKQHRVSLKTGSAKQARVLALRLEDKLTQGNHHAAKPPTLQAVIDAYDTFLTTEGRAKKTLDKYRKVFERIKALASARRTRTIVQVDISFVDAYRRQRVAAGAQPKTVYVETIVLRQMINFALSRRLVTVDPLAGLRIKKPKPRAQPCWTREEVESILEASHEPQRSTFTVLADTGMRVGELIHLTRDDIDLERSLILIRPKAEWKPKTGDQRAIPMSKRVKQVLESLPRHHRWVFTAAPSHKHPNGGGQLSERRLLVSLNGYSSDWVYGGTFTRFGTRSSRTRSWKTSPRRWCGNGSGM